MHICKVLKDCSISYSFEFFPPKKETAWNRFYERIIEFQKLSPHFVSVTYGAGGSSREKTHDLVRRIKTDTKLNPIPHLTCVCHTEGEIRELLSRYSALGINNIMALGGDPPESLASGEECQGEFAHAADLVAFIKKFNESGEHPDKDGFGIGVAGFPEGHPGTPNRVQELEYLKRKVDEGADYICTQMFFDNNDFFDFKERCEIIGITVPIIAGLMPVTSKRSFQRIPTLALGSRYPAQFMRKVLSYEQDEDIKKAGIEWCIGQSYELITNDVAGIHYYTLNRYSATEEIFRRLGIYKTTVAESV